MYHAKISPTVSPMQCAINLAKGNISKIKPLHPLQTTPGKENKNHPSPSNQPYRRQTGMTTAPQEGRDKNSRRKTCIIATNANTLQRATTMILGTGR
jgi:hypothetical protein